MAAQMPAGKGGRWAASAALGAVVVWVAVRWWLQARLDNNGWVLPPELALAIDPDVFIQRLQGITVAVLVVCGLLWWLLRSRSPQTVRRTLWGLLVAWVGVWLWGAISLAQNHANRLNLTPTQTETLKVVGVQVSKPSTRSVGGAKVYVDWPAQGGLHTVMIEDASEALMRQPAHLSLTLAPGRSHGWYVLGWSVPGADAKGQP